MSLTKENPDPAPQRRWRAITAAAAATVAIAAVAAVPLWPNAPTPTEEVHAAVSRSADDAIEWTRFLIESADLSGGATDAFFTGSYTREGEAVAFRNDTPGSTGFAEIRDIGAWTFADPGVGQDWMVFGSGSTLLPEGNGETLFSDFAPRDFLQQLTSVGTFGKGAPDVVAGVPSTRYSAEDGLTELGAALDEALGTEGRSPVYGQFEVWIDDDGLIRQVAATTAPGGSTNSADPNRITVTATEINGDARIDPPEPSLIGPEWPIRLGAQRLHLLAELEFRREHSDDCRTELAEESGRGAALVDCLRENGGDELANLVEPQVGASVDDQGAEITPEIEACVRRKGGLECDALWAQSIVEQAKINDPARAQATVDALVERERCVAEDFESLIGPDGVPTGDIGSGLNGPGSSCDEVLNQTLRDLGFGL